MIVVVTANTHIDLGPIGVNVHETMSQRHSQGGIQLIKTCRSTLSVFSQDRQLWGAVSRGVRGPCLLETFYVLPDTEARQAPFDYNRVLHRPIGGK